MKSALLITGILVAGLGSGCSAHGSDAGFDSDGGAGSGGGSGGPGLGGGSSGGTPGSGQVVLYGHTDTILYQCDPANLTASTEVGRFDCIGSGGAASMTDLAVTKGGKLYGVSEGAAFPLTIQGGVVHCEAMWTLPNTKFYGLTVAPENSLSAQEVLIAADGAGGLYEVDANNGVPTQVGTLGLNPQSGRAWSLSGDIVFLANDGNPIGFATVRDCHGGTSTCSKNDTLIEVDVKAIRPGTQSVLKAVRGPVIRGSWCTNASSPSSFGSMFGIVAYDDKVFGFSRSGDIVEIHNDDGSACLISSNPSMKFAGAGVTTSAPVKAPPPK